MREKGQDGDEVFPFSRFFWEWGRKNDYRILRKKGWQVLKKGGPGVRVHYQGGEKGLHGDRKERGGLKGAVREEAKHLQFDGVPNKSPSKKERVGGSKELVDP